MSASDSGVVILAAPVILTVGAVSLAAAGISAAAQKYKASRLSKAEALESAKKTALDEIIEQADLNRKEYEEIMEERIREELTRQEKDEMLQDAARIRIREEMLSRNRIAEEIRSQIENMDRAVKAFEDEFGENREVRDMAQTIHRSQEMFGDGSQLLKDLQDLILVIIPGMTKEKRTEQHVSQIDDMLSGIEADRMYVSDSSEKFVSLSTGSKASKRESTKTPWESFVERVRAVAAVESEYYEDAAANMLEEAEQVAPARRNFYIQQNQGRLIDLEERCADYRSRKAQVSEKVMEDYFMYLAIAEKVGIEPRYTEEDLSDAYAVADMREDTEELVEEYKKSKERQYVTNAFTVVMKRHNLTFENMAVGDDGMTELEYSMDEQTGVSIRRSESGAFEMQFNGKSKGASASMDEKRSITEKARHFCSLLPSIVKELDEEFGITFDQTSLQPPQTENIRITQAASSGRTERARTLKAMTMH